MLQGDGHGPNLQDMLRIPEAIAAMIALKVPCKMYEDAFSLDSGF